MVLVESWEKVRQKSYLALIGGKEMSTSRFYAALFAQPWKATGKVKKSRRIKG